MKRLQPRAACGRISVSQDFCLVREEGNMRKRILVFVMLAAAAHGQSPSNETSAGSHSYTLKATPKTVVWGYYDAAAEPVLRIQSGDTVEFETLITNTPAGLKKAALPADQVQQSLPDIHKEVTNKGPGGHILNGPVYVEGAEPGDT